MSTSCFKPKWYTYDSVILAADGVGVAIATGANSNNGDGRAIETEEDINSLDYDSEQTKQETPSRGASLQTRSHNLSQCYK